MKIRKLHISTYKVFDEAIFDFIDKEGNTLDTIVLAGVNGCGKTSILELIRNIVTGHPISDNTIKKVHAELSFSKVESINHLPSSSTSPNILSIDALVNPLLFSTNSVYFPINEPEEDIKDVGIIHINDKKNMEVRIWKSIREAIFKRKDENAQAIIEELIQKVNYLLSDFKLNTKLVAFEGERMIFESLNRQRISFNSLSNGEKSLFFRTISLYQLNINEGIILVDEPEDSMHPIWQKSIISLYQKVGNNNQVIIATHSPHIMASVRPESLFLLHIDSTENCGTVQVLNMAKEGKQSKGLEPNRILKEIMEVEVLRAIETQQAMDKLTTLLNLQDFIKPETLALIAELREDLGMQDPFILKVNHQILMLNRQKENLTNAIH